MNESVFNTPSLVQTYSEPLTIPGVTNPPAANPPFQYDPSQIPDYLSSGTSFDQKYNELTYKTEIYLDNSGNFTNSGTEGRYSINPSAVLNLSIVDTVNDWVVDGSITIMYLPEDINPSQVADTAQAQKTATGARDNGNALRSYQFRSDGFDLLRVSMVPITKGEQTSSDTGSIIVSPTDPYWYLSYLFSIYDVEDVTSNIPQTPGFMSAYLKCVKLHFRDVRYQVLKTTNLEYSTALSPKAVVDPSLANGDNNDGKGRVLFTGDAIKEVFDKAFDVDGTLGLNGKTLAKYGEGTDWDIGEGKIFYTSPANWNADDDIEYLFSHHVSKSTLTSGANDLCLLHTNRAAKPNELEPICITPLAEFFKKAGSGSGEPGELQLEHFFVTSQTNHKPTPGGTKHRAPLDKNGNSSTKDVKTSKYGQILSYSFVDMSAEMNSTSFKTTPVYSVDVGKRTFRVEFKGNDVESARKAIGGSYIDQLYKEGNGENLFLTTLHSTKKTTNVFPTFSLNGDNKIVRQRNGILDLIYTGLFQNACICFKTLGLTLRQSGTFIGIDKIEGAEINDYNDKLYGQWFVVKVDHVFEGGKYYNNIYAVKLHRFADPKTKFGSTL
jgi:hypothetical protein